MITAITFAVVFAVYFVAHHVADYWIQSDWQARTKGAAGWTGRAACAAHVATYTLTLAAFLALAAWWLALPVSPGRAAAGLAVSALTHYFADRRRPLAKLADRTGKGTFYRAGEGLASGAAHLDQSWHLAWVLIAALITARGM